ncbi:MAG: metal ABC transporter substrate-binding protein [Candidatus Latescibacter sp.]|nr:metal ABC transporter substrate-binding protein [Candidatus Latescibacter sp.]
MKSHSFLILSILIISTLSTSLFAAPIRIVAALPDLGSIASYIGGDKVAVSTIAKANSNPHSVEVFPSYMAQVSKASVYLKSGLALDQWSDAIIDGSRNNRIVAIDCSEGIAVLEKPTGKVDASMGDVHAFGNPHYWLNPENGIMIAQNIATVLQKVDPVNTAYYSSRLEQFRKECLDKISAWKEKLKSLRGAKIMTYHSSWAYFADAFGFSIVAKVEPFPGIPPSGNHLAKLVKVIKNENVSFIIQEPYFSDDALRFLNRQTGVKVFKCAPSCSDIKLTSYFEHFDEIVNQLAAAAGGK